MFIFSFATENDKLKFDQLFEKYQRLLLHKAYSILNDYALAEDAVSDAYIRIYKSLHKIDDTSSAKTVSFLITIVRNTALTILEKRKKYKAQESEVHDNEYIIEDTILSDIITYDMLSIVDTLKEELRTPFLLKYAHDLSHREIASILNISENNVTVRIHRAKSKLTKLFIKAGYVYGKQ